MPAPILLVLWGAMVWLGAGTVLRPVTWVMDQVGIDANRIRPVVALQERFEVLVWY